MESAYEITTLARSDHPPAPAATAYPPLAPSEIPPGVAMVTLADGRRTLAYTQTPAPVPAPPAAPVRRGVDPVAQRMAAGGLLLAGGGFFLSALAGAVTSLVVVLGIVLAAKLGGTRRGGDVHVHQRAGLFGRNTTHIS